MVKTNQIQVSSLKLPKDQIKLTELIAQSKRIKVKSCIKQNFQRKSLLESKYEESSLASVVDKISKDTESCSGLRCFNVISPPIGQIVWKNSDFVDNVKNQQLWETIQALKRNCNTDDELSQKNSLCSISTIETVQSKIELIPCSLVQRNGKMLVVMSTNEKPINDCVNQSWTVGPKSCQEKHVDKIPFSIKWNDLCTIEELKVLEDQLKNSEDARKYLTTEMLNNSGRTAKQFIIKNLSRMMTDDLAKMHNWTGGFGYARFKGTIISSILLDLAMKCFSSCTTNQLENIIKIWFKQTHCRLKICTRDNMRPK